MRASRNLSGHGGGTRAALRMRQLHLPDPPSARPPERFVGRKEVEQQLRVQHRQRRATFASLERHHLVAGADDAVQRLADLRTRQSRGGRVQVGVDGGEGRRAGPLAVKG